MSISDPWVNISPIEPTPVKIVKQALGAPSDLRIAVITPTKNEALNIQQFLTQVGLQTYPIFMHIFVDGYSHDGTYEKLIEHSATQNGIAVLQSDKKPGAARNLAWDLITNEIDFLVFMDAGCFYEIDYIEKLIATLSVTDSNFAYTPNSTNQHTLDPKDNPLEPYSKFSQQDWDNWLPPIRGVAIRNPSAVCSRFPNWVTFAGDDTLFDIHLKNELKSCSVFLGDFPLVDWNPPEGTDKLKAMYSKYYFGDGETGSRDWLGGAPAEYQASYRAGKSSRADLDNNRGVQKIFVVLSRFTAGSSFEDSGVTGLAMKLTKERARVIFGASATGGKNETPTWFDGDISLFSNFMLENEDFAREVATYLAKHKSVTIIVTDVSRSFLEIVINLLKISKNHAKTPVVEYRGSSWFSLKYLYFRIVVWSLQKRIGMTSVLTP